MPTLDWLQQTALDRFYERGGEDPLPPRPLPCPVCGEPILDQTLLADHLGSSHPLSAPRLLINGAAIVGDRILHRHPPRDAVEVANAAELLVSENGGPSKPWSVAALRDTLSGRDSVLLDVTLRNSRAGDGTTISERVRLRVAVPDPTALDVADRCFLELLARDNLDEFWLDRFVDAAAERPSGARYASALHEYGVAILVKDQVGGTTAALPFAAHRDKLQRSLSVLREFPERPVARAVCGFIGFGLNDFSGDTRPSGVPELDRCAGALRTLAEATSGAVTPAGAVGGRCPTDAATAFILEHWEEPDASRELSEYAGRASITPEDRAKCQALALRASGETSTPRLDLARALANDPVFGTWAEQMLEEGPCHG